MRKAKVFVIVALAAVMTVLPLSASATTASPAPSGPSEVATPTDEGPSAPQALLWPGECRHAWTYVWHPTGIRSEPKLGDNIIGSITIAKYIPCRVLALGDRYNGCDGTNANGWILVALGANPNDSDFRPPQQGWIMSTCTKDPHPLPG